MSLSSSAVRMMLRPMRPKPLMPTLMGITSSDGVSEIAAVQERVTAAGEQKMLGVARRKVNARRNRAEKSGDGSISGSRDHRPRRSNLIGADGTSRDDAGCIVDATSMTQ